MLTIFWLGIVAFAGLYVFNYWQCYSRNLKAARDSGIPYVVAPVYTFNRMWLVTHRLWIPLLEKLPSSWTESWISFVDPEWVWKRKFEAFKTMGADMFIICSPGKNSLIVANAEATSQIVTRRNDFPKPIEMYGSVDLFGKNVVSTEGQVWRHHRKITSPPFTESNNQLVWQESLRQGKSMVTSWIGNGDASHSSIISDISAATMRLSLYVISYAGFGVKLLWPHEASEEAGHADGIPEGHSLSYKDALSALLENIIPVMLIPRWFISRSPFKSNQVAYRSYLEWGKYMREIYESKKAEIKAGDTRDGMDLMGALVSGAGITAESLNAQESGKSGTSSGQLLTDDEILGNSFVFILAGHETAAGVLHFSILYLAMNWSSQARLQKDLDEIFGDRPVSEWDYERDVPKLFGSMCGAVMNEELRVIPPVVGIPKSTRKGAAQPMTLSGKRVIVPADSFITLNTVATHRNPKYWPTMCGSDATEAEKERDLDTFKPERWLLDHDKPRNLTAESATEQYSESDADDYGGPNGSDTAAGLFHPPRGAYIPFSEGARGCLGRRFAQIEILAVLAVIFREYSVELALDEYATEEELAAMTDEDRRKTWSKGKSTAEDLLKSGMGTIITLQMRKGKVPMRFVKRGSERFKYD